MTVLRRPPRPWLVTPAFWLVLANLSAAGEPFRYDLLLRGGPRVPPKNGGDRGSGVAVWGGKVARVAPEIPAESARLVVPVAGLYVVPGLVDIHAHVYNGTGARHLAGDLSVVPDAHTFRSGVTTVVDAGT